jgi:hypothetical protein
MAASDHKETKIFGIPNWLIYTFGFLDLIVSIAIISLLVLGDYEGLTFSEFWKPGMFVFILFLLNYLFFRVFLSSVTISQEGIESTSPVSSKKFIGWNEITEVSRPLLRIPSEYTYVVSARHEKLTLFRSYPEYHEIIKLIKERSPKLEKCNY